MGGPPSCMQQAPHHATALRYLQRHFRPTNGTPGTHAPGAGIAVSEREPTPGMDPRDAHVSLAQRYRLLLREHANDGGPSPDVARALEQLEAEDRRASSSRYGTAVATKGARASRGGRIADVRASSSSLPEASPSADRTCGREGWAAFLLDSIVADAPHDVERALGVGAVCPDVPLRARRLARAGLTRTRLHASVVPVGPGAAFWRTDLSGGWFSPSDRCTPLMIAVGSGSARAAEVLLLAGVRPWPSIDWLVRAAAASEGSPLQLLLLPPLGVSERPRTMPSAGGPRSAVPLSPRRPFGDAVPYDAAAVIGLLLGQPNRGHAGAGAASAAVWGSPLTALRTQLTRVVDHTGDVDRATAAFDRCARLLAGAGHRPDDPARGVARVRDARDAAAPLVDRPDVSPWVQRACLCCAVLTAAQLNQAGLTSCDTDAPAGDPTPHWAVDARRTIRGECGGGDRGPCGSANDHPPTKHKGPGGDGERYDDGPQGDDDDDDDDDYDDNDGPFAMGPSRDETLASDHRRGGTRCPVHMHAGDAPLVDSTCHRLQSETELQATRETLACARDALHRPSVVDEPGLAEDRELQGTCAADVVAFLEAVLRAYRDMANRHAAPRRSEAGTAQRRIRDLLAMLRAIASDDAAAVARLASIVHPAEPLWTTTLAEGCGRVGLVVAGESPTIEMRGTQYDRNGGSSYGAFRLRHEPDTVPCRDVGEDVDDIWRRLLAHGLLDDYTTPVEAAAMLGSARALHALAQAAARSAWPRAARDASRPSRRFVRSPLPSRPLVESTARPCDQSGRDPWHALAPVLSARGLVLLAVGRLLATSRYVECARLACDHVVDERPVAVPLHGTVATLELVLDVWRTYAGDPQDVFGAGREGGDESPIVVLVQSVERAHESGNLAPALAAHGETVWRAPLQCLFDAGCRPRMAAGGAAKAMERCAQTCPLFGDGAQNTVLDVVSEAALRATRVLASIRESGDATARQVDAQEALAGVLWAIHKACVDFPDHPAVGLTQRDRP